MALYMKIGYAVRWGQVLSRGLNPIQITRRWSISPATTSGVWAASSTATPHGGAGTARLSPISAALCGLTKASKSSDAVTGSGSLDVTRYGRVLKARRLVGVRGAGAAFDPQAPEGVKTE